MALKIPGLIDSVKVEHSGCGGIDTFYSVSWKCPKCEEFFVWLSDDGCDRIAVEKISGNIVCLQCGLVMVIENGNIIANFRKEGFRTELEIGK